MRTSTVIETTLSIHFGMSGSPESSGALGEDSESSEEQDEFAGPFKGGR